MRKSSARMKNKHKNSRAERVKDNFENKFKSGIFYINIKL